MRLVLFIAVALLTAPAQGAFDVFLQVTPVNSPAIAGGATDPLYSGWVKVLAFESGSALVPGSGPHDLPKVEFTPFTLIKAVDQATPLFYQALATGADLSTVKMVVVNRTPQRVELWDINAQTCLFTSQSFSATGGETDLAERLSFLVRKFEYSYIELAPSGDALTEIFANWSVVTDRGAYGTRAPFSLGDLDTDGDGIPDGWELFHGLNQSVADGTLDTDGDGLDNLHEFIAHTDPRVPQSTLRVTAFQPGAPGNYLLTWQSVAGLNYRIFTAPAPGGPFTFLKNVPSAGDGTTSTTVAGPAGQFFYRVVTP